MIVKYVDEKKERWDDFLDTCVYSYNTSKQESSQYSLFELMFAQKPVLPVDISTEQKDPDAMLMFNNKSYRSILYSHARAT